MAIGSVGVDWAKSDRNLVLLLHHQCRFCTESSSFYRRLLTVAGRAKTRTVALFPHDAALGSGYLAKLDLPISIVRGQVTVPWMVLKTPTVVLCDSKGRILRAWVGKLDSAGEQELINALLRY